MDTVTTDTTISPLRQRMTHDMMMRGLGPHTQHDYIRHVRRLAAFLGRPPDTATEEDLRRFQIHQHEAGASIPTINGMRTGSNGGLPPLPRALRRSATTSGPRKTSKSTTDASRSSGSPAALSASYRSERSKKPGCPAIIASAVAQRQ